MRYPGRNRRYPQRPYPVQAHGPATEAEAETVKLAPCPFCGGESATVVVTYRTVDREFGADRVQIECLDCRSRGPVEDSSSEAGKAWNRRLVTVTWTPGVD